MVDLHERGETIDRVTLANELMKVGQLQSVDGLSYLVSLDDGLPQLHNLESYVAIVKEKALLRRIIAVSHDAIERCFASNDDPKQILGSIEDAFMKLGDVQAKNTLASPAQIITEYDGGINAFLDTSKRIKGISTGFLKFDEMTGGLREGELFILAARPAMGKCLAADSEILLSDGSIKTIEQICRVRQAELLTLDDHGKFELTFPSAFVDDGFKPVFRVSTHLGRSVKSTLPHPFLTRDGWKKLIDLKAGDVIAVPRTLPVFGREELSVEQIKAYADLLTESCVTSSGGSGGSEFAIESLTAKQSASFAWAKGGGAVIAELDGQSIQKFVPEAIFRSTRESVAAFLNHLFATVGWASVLDNGQSQVGFATVSERLSQQVQHLLLRFGIIAFLEQTVDLDPGYESNIWQLKITDAESIEIFVSEIGIFGQEKALARMPKSHAKAPANDLYWDRIVAIEYLGEQQVYDLTIPKTHNFVANDICVHNTALALNMAQHVASNPHNPKAVAVFSLEMSKESLLTRMLCASARVDQQRFRAGYLNADERRSLQDAMYRMVEAPLFLDDTAGTNLMDVHSKLRRLQAEHDLGLVIIDYLQLMQGRGRFENRVQEISSLSRGFKLLSKELRVPFLVLSQLSRAPEPRPGDHRPMLSDLRESGCLTGDTLVPIACSGKRVPIRDLAGTSKFRVWTLNEKTLKLEKALVSNAFATGTKPVFELRTQLGRTIRATRNHPFRTFSGWKRLDELATNEYLALPRIVPGGSTQTMSDAELGLLGHLIGDGCMLPRHVIQYTTRERELAELVSTLAIDVFGDEISPRIAAERTWFQVYLSSTRSHTHNVHSPITDWLTDLGAFGWRAWEKRIPRRIFEQSPEGIGIFLRHLWATDGCINLRKVGSRRTPVLYYATSSQALAQDLQSLLLRLEINARLKRVSQGKKGRDQFHVIITGAADVRRAIDRIGSVGQRRQQALDSVREWIDAHPANPNRDIIPNDVWRKIAVPAMRAADITTREMSEALDTAYCGSSIYKQNISRERAARLGAAISSPEVRALSESDLYWDKVVSVTPAGMEEVYDLTVPDHHNFVANDFVVHNSIEQDADMVAFIFREEVYRPDKESLKGMAELILAKQRNGPTGRVKLAFLNRFTKFENLAVDTGDDEAPFE